MYTATLRCFANCTIPRSSRTAAECANTVRCAGARGHAPSRRRGIRWLQTLSASTNRRRSSPEKAGDILKSNSAFGGELDGSRQDAIYGNAKQGNYALHSHAPHGSAQSFTFIIVYSATKGLAAMTLAIAHSRGWLDYEERVAKYWPEFAQQGKERITVRQLLAHQAGLFAFHEPVDRSSSPTWITWRSCSLVRSRRGSLGRVRPITRSPSGSAKGSCCAASIRGIAASDSSFRTRSPHRSGSLRGTQIRTPFCINGPTLGRP